MFESKSSTTSSPSASLLVAVFSYHHHQHQHHHYHGCTASAPSCFCSHCSRFVQLSLLLLLLISSSIIPLIPSSSILIYTSPHHCHSVHYSSSPSYITLLTPSPIIPHPPLSHHSPHYLFNRTQTNNECRSCLPPLHSRG